MLRDVFYYGPKPNVHPREKIATSIDDARSQCTTEHFWIITEQCDYRNFDWDWDFEFLPDEDVWAEEHNNVWPSFHQKDSGTWLCPKQASEIIVYRADVEPLKRKNEKNNNWVLLDLVDETKFDFSWHPDPTDPPFIYVWGNKWNPVELQPVLEYHTPYAFDRKYMDQIVELLPNEHFKEIIPIDKSKFDLSWRPDPREPPFVYVWGSKWNEAAVEPVLAYYCPGATDRKYLETLLDLMPNKTNWEIPDNIDTAGFDFSWRPNPTSPPYIYQFGTQHQKTGGPRYVVEDATDIKYVDIQKAKRLPNKSNWKELLPIDNFDYSWHPDDTDPPLIYEFGTQHQSTGGLRYEVEGASEIKYIDTLKATVVTTEISPNWIIPNTIDISQFDFSWHPNTNEKPYIYQFGTQHQKTGGPKYIVENATDIKYVDVQKVNRLPNKENWKELLPITNFDYSWHPDDTEPPFVYVWGSKWNEAAVEPVLAYYCPDATERKYMFDEVELLPDQTNWEIPDNIDATGFDFSWRPNPTSPPYIYQFGTQHQKTGGPKYIVENATDIKYVNDIQAVRLPNMENWKISEGIAVSDFDFSWHPDDTSPPFVYRFGTILDRDDGPRYLTPNNTGESIYMERITVSKPIEIEKSYPKYLLTTTVEDLVKQHPDEIFWALNPHIDYTNFNFDWKPNIEQSQYIQVFGSSENTKTQTFLVNSVMWLRGYTELNWVEEQVKNKIDMFFVDRSNSESQTRFEKLKIKFPNITKTRYLNSWVDTINRCINRATTNLCWILNSELDYDDFDFEYYPNPWQMKMVHVFGTQWSHWGTTYLINKETFPQDTKYIKIIEHLSNLNFVKTIKARASNVLYDIVYIDHGNKDLSKVNNLIVKYENNYLNTFKIMLDKLPAKKEHYIWVISTVCDYKEFDFTYICDPFAKEHLHVFPSDKQKFGDTFLIDVNKLRALVDTMNSLEEYGKINYNQHQRVKRLAAPVIITENDTHVSSVNTDFDFPYAVFVTEDNKNINMIDTEPMNLWSNETKNITITSTGGTRIVVPKETKQYVKKELYDYPYIITNNKLIESNPLDIVFFSNGEASADRNYEHLLKLTKSLPNNVTRVDGINGRVKSQHAAANNSNTPWYFLVNAKLKVSAKFDFNWQPDRLQIPKHYIFHATNPVNGLVYGHQAIVANNKKLTLENFGTGLDFTMDSEHEVVPVNSGIGMFNSSEWDTWRTAFRECIKLKASGTEENNIRLNTWVTTAIGDFAEYSLQGAQHAVQYYEQVKGDLTQLRLSYDWVWLREKFNKIYGIRTI